MISPQRRKDAKKIWLKMSPLFVHIYNRSSVNCQQRHVLAYPTVRIQMSKMFFYRKNYSPLRLENMLQAFSTDYIHVIVCAFAVKCFFRNSSYQSNVCARP